MTAALLAGILAASVLGSVHCVAMCGPLVALHGGVRTLRLAAVHSLGRLATYAAIGALAGALGSALDLAGRAGHVQRIATLVAGAAIIAWGLAAMLATRRTARPRPSSPAASSFGSALVRIRTRKPELRAAAIGALTGLLPCGWLWAFAITAGATAHPLDGALVMATFWLGTVPAMLGVLTLGGPVITRLRARMPVIAGITLLALGLGTLALRWHDAGTTQVTAPHCHCHHAEPT